MRGRWFGVALLFLCTGGAIAQPGRPWMNTALSPDARANLVQAQMTRDEEFILVDGYLGVDDRPYFHDAIPPWL